MNILMVGLDLNPPWVEGIRNTVRELSLELMKRGHHLAFLTKGEGGCCLVEGITYYRAGGGRKGYLSGFHTFALRSLPIVKELSKEFDVIHYHSSYLGFGAYFELARLRSGGSKSFFTLYSYATSPPTFEYSSALRAGLRLAKSVRFWRPLLKSHIIVISRAAYTKVRRHFPPHRVSLLPLPLNIETFRRAPRDNLREELRLKGEKLVLFAGDLTPYKGVEVLLRALKVLVERGMGCFTCLLLSKGLYEKYAKREQLIRSLIVRLGLNGMITFLGPRKDIAKVYKASDVVVLPFLEGYSLMDVPRALLEAMASARPVIASRVGAIDEVIKDGFNGLLTRPGDVKELAEAIEMVLVDEELARELGRRAADYVARNHDVRSVVDRLEVIYKHEG